MEYILIVIAMLAAAGLGALFAWKRNLSATERLNEQIREQNEQFRQESLRLYDERESWIQNLDSQISSRLNQLQQADTAIQSVQEQEQARLQAALAAYIDTLDLCYVETEIEFDEKMKELKEELEKMRAARAANIQAILREKEIKEKENFYKILISDIDLSDIEILEEVKPKLRRPEILSKLIWSTYYLKAVNTLCSNVIGEKVTTGIYKITEIPTGLVYIGKSVNIAQRWKDHVKAALGASNTISNNKLYAAMRESGVYNFTFEILEIVPASRLDEREKYYINFYQSNIYGLNVVKGNLTS